MRVTFFDVECANIKNKAICQIGLLSYDIDTGSNVEKVNVLINPNEDFDENCVSNNSITTDMVKDKPTIDVVWKNIQHFFLNSIVVGHNIAHYDLNALEINLKRYGISLPDIYYVSIFDLARRTIPSYLVTDYSLSSLCRFFGIKYSFNYDALQKTCIFSGLLEIIIKNGQINIMDEIQDYHGMEAREKNIYLISENINNKICELYGDITGFLIDGNITEGERQFLLRWRKENEVLLSNSSVADIIVCIDKILGDGTVTLDEMNELENIITKHLDFESNSMVLLSVKILKGILNGIVADDEITDDECSGLRKWLYGHSYLSGQAPFDKIFSILDNISVSKNIQGKDLLEINNIIYNFTKPLNILKEKIGNFGNKKVFLSGVFSIGDKSVVEQYVKRNGGRIDNTLTATTDLVIIGRDNKNDNIEIKNVVASVDKLNKNGYKVKIFGENEVIPEEPVFSDLLFSFIDRKNLNDSDVYNKAMIDRRLFSKIRCNSEYLPSKKTILQFAIALELNLAETNQLLRSCGMILSHSFNFDRIVEKNIRNGNYNLFKIDEELYDANEDVFIS